MLSKHLRGLALVVVLLGAGGCPPDTVEEIVEDETDFEGLETPLPHHYIVGLTPEPEFNNLHCCWVGTRTGWKRILKGWKTEEKTAVNSSVLGVLEALSIKISADTVQYLEAEADFYRDELKNIRHFTREGHCHQGCQATSMCGSALKVGHLTLNTYLKLGLEAEGKLKELNLELVKIGGNSFLKQFKEYSPDVIVGYKMYRLTCGRSIWWENAEGHRGASGHRLQIRCYKDLISGATDEGEAEKETEEKRTEKRAETYEDHSRAFDDLLERDRGKFSYESRLPNSRFSIREPMPPQDAILVTPPRDALISGQVIRVTSVDKEYRPRPVLSGLVVTETDREGQTHSRVVAPDFKGGAWIRVGENTQDFRVGVAERPQDLGEPQDISDGASHFSGEPRQPQPYTLDRPVVTQVVQRGGGVPGVVESGNWFDLTGEDFGTVTAIETEDGRRLAPLAVGNNFVTAEVDHTGTLDLRIVNSQSLISDPVSVDFIRIVVEQAPPQTMERGQTAPLVLRIRGSSRPLKVQLTIQSPTVEFPQGATQQTLTSSGGRLNRIETRIHARAPGPFQIDYLLLE